MFHRPLVALETPYVALGTASAGSLVVRGDIDPDQLTEAFAALRREYPVLAGRIVADDTGLQLTAPEPAEDIPFTRISFARQSFSPGDVRLGIDAEHRLSAVHLDSNGDVHRITFGVSHAVADGTHTLALLLRLIQLYANPDDQTTPAPALPLSPADVADRFSHGRASAPRSVTGTCAGVIPDTDALTQGEFGFKRLVLGAQSTSHLRERAKASGLSLHGFLAGAIVAAERAELDVPDDAEVPMAVFSPVDLRGRAVPVLAPTAVTNCAGSSTADIIVTAESSIESIGAQVIAQLQADLSDGSVVGALTGRVTEVVGAPIRLSNIGVVPIPSEISGIRIDDFYTSSEVDINRVRGFAAVAPPQALEPLVGMHYHALTFDGRLSIEMRYAPGTLSETAIDRIAGRIADSINPVHSGNVQHSVDGLASSNGVV